MERKYANKLRELRGNRSRATVAKAVGVSVSSIAMYERGERTPKDDTKIKLAKYYGKTITSIFFAP